MLMKKAIMVLTIASVNAWCELCSELGDAAAGKIARDFCESDVRTRRVRNPAIRRCRDKVEEEIWNVCKGSPISTNHLHTLQDRCDRTVDWIVEWYGRVWGRCLMILLVCIDTVVNPMLMMFVLGFCLLERLRLSLTALLMTQKEQDYCVIYIQSTSYFKVKIGIATLAFAT